MTLAELETKWTARLGEWRALGASVSGERVAAEIVADLRAIETTTADELLTPTQAAAVTGYHPESIARLVRTGKITNHGSKHRPRVKRSELPAKAHREGRGVAKQAQSDASCVGSIEHIASDALAGRLGRS